MIGLGLKTEDNSELFKQRSSRFVELVLGLASSGIERRIKTSGKTPYQHGGLRSGIRSMRTKEGTYRVVSDKEYSRAMEEGVINGSPIRNWSTPGTGAGWFRDGVENTLERLDEFIKTAKQATGIK